MELNQTIFFKKIKNLWLQDGGIWAKNDQYLSIK